MTSITSKEVIAAVATIDQNMEDATIQPAILANRNFAIEDVEEFWSSNYNHSWSDKINEKLADGFIVIRIQTEWKIDNHNTMIYMVKMKK